MVKDAWAEHWKPGSQERTEPHTCMKAPADTKRFSDGKTQANAQDHDVTLVAVNTQVITSARLRSSPFSMQCKPNRKSRNQRFQWVSQTFLRVSRQVLPPAIIGGLSKYLYCATFMEMEGLCSLVQGIPGTGIKSAAQFPSLTANVAATLKRHFATQTGR